MKEYWLMQNFLFNHTYIIRGNKFRKILKFLKISEYNLRIDLVQATDEEDARIKFESLGFKVGVGF